MKTFEQIIKENYPRRHCSLHNNAEVIEVMEFVRVQTLKECAKLVTLSEDENKINSLGRNSLDL